MYEKPKAKLAGENGNVFNLMSIVSKTLTFVGEFDKQKEFVSKIPKSSSYDESLSIMLDYVDNCYSQKEANKYNKKYREYHLKQKLEKEQDEIEQTKKSILKTFESDDTLIL